MKKILAAFIALIFVLLLAYSVNAAPLLDGERQYPTATATTHVHPRVLVATPKPPRERDNVRPRDWQPYCFGDLDGDGRMELCAKN